MKTHQELSFPRSSVTLVHKHLLVLDGDGVTLAVYNGMLVFRSREIKLTMVPARTRTVLMAGYGGSITLHAMTVAAVKHVEILLWGPRSEAVMFAPMVDASRAALSLRLHQFEAIISPRKTLMAAKAIVAAKLKAEGHGPANRKLFTTMLEKAQSTDDVRHVEAQAAQVWWSQWSMFEMRFAGPSVPAEWRVWPGRYIGRRQGRLGELGPQFTARGAVHPMQAVL
jgi:CRISPR/Cas system-associated endonuclease Cas1